MVWASQYSVGYSLYLIMNDLIFKSAYQLARMIKECQVSAVDLTQAGVRVETWIPPLRLW